MDRCSDRPLLDSRLVALTMVVAGIAPVIAVEQVSRTPYGLGLVRTTTYTAPSQVYSLRVTPTDQQGLGRYGAQYHFSIKGNHAWVQKRPYTLREVVVTDRGMIVGFAYRTECQPTGGRLNPRKYFHVVVMDREGEEVLNKVTQRMERRKIACPPSPSRPYAEQLVVDAENDRIIVRVVEAEGVEPTHTWWLYRLSTGQPLGRFDPTRLAADRNHFAWVSTIAVVPGTPLTLVHYVMQARTGDLESIGSRFALIDQHEQLMWSVDFPDEFTGLYKGHAGRALASQLRECPAILETGQPNHFDLRLFQENRRVTFSVEQDATGELVVSELGRVDVESGVESGDIIPISSR